MAVEPERFNGIGRVGCVFFRKSFVVCSVRVSTRGFPSVRAPLSPLLAKESAGRSLSSQLNRSCLEQQRLPVNPPPDRDSGLGDFKFKPRDPFT